VRHGKHKPPVFLIQTHHKPVCPIHVIDLFAGWPQPDFPDLGPAIAMPIGREVWPACQLLLSNGDRQPALCHCHAEKQLVQLINAHA
jgi:hypothetical protein